MEEFDPSVFAQNVRMVRLRARISQRDLAKRAEIDKQTLYRVERGFSSTARVRESIARALNTRVERLARKPSVTGPGYVAHKKKDDFWIETTTHRRTTPVDEARHAEEIQDSAERLRLGRLGLVETFTRPFVSAAPDSFLSSGVIELYRDSTAASMPNELFAYCLRGAIEFRFTEETIRLEADESITIFPGVVGEWGPADPIGPYDLPPLLLYVVNRQI